LAWVETIEYSNLGFTVIALFAGIVHGVVVQITAPNVLLSTPLVPDNVGPSFTMGNLMVAALLVCISSYCNSASARAVLELGDQ